MLTAQKDILDLATYSTDDSERDDFIEHRCATDEEVEIVNHNHLKEKITPEARVLFEREKNNHQYALGKLVADWTVRNM
ncbi:hypothetical protein [Bdellovibrio sp. BCCA]|uniref:hypothetical protein n=1 Tax=Bdellovibrio sp. BCCA TaxID=3136281 RepID=UPI0030F36D84